eukprot:1226130-Amorphochlora_amoeboformis.AAC.1
MSHSGMRSRGRVEGVIGLSNGTRFQILHINGSAGPPSPVYCKSKIVLQDVRTHRKMLLGEEISGNEVNLFIALVKVDRKDLRSIQWE